MPNCGPVNGVVQCAPDPPGYPGPGVCQTALCRPRFWAAGLSPSYCAGLGAPSLPTPECPAPTPADASRAVKPPVPCVAIA